MVAEEKHHQDWRGEKGGATPMGEGLKGYLSPEHPDMKERRRTEERKSSLNCSTKEIDKRNGISNDENQDVLGTVLNTVGGGQVQSRVLFQ